MAIETKQETVKSNINKKAELSLNILELFLWIGSGICYIYYMWTMYFEYDSKYDNVRNHYSLTEFFNFNSKGLLLSFALIIIPLLALLVFGNLPISGLRSNIRNISLIFGQLQEAVTNELAALFITDDIIDKVNIGLPKSVAEIMDNQILEAKVISEKIYQRSGTYLFVGSLISILGVFSFYMFNLNSHQQLLGVAVTPNSDKIEIINFLQRVSILIFIEFVAFFFLRQYRVLLEEFRYYEAIKRKRQENRLIVSLTEEYSNKPEVLKIILEKCAFFHERPKLGQNETTETLEIQKITKDDFNVIDKVIDTLKELKGK